MRKKERISLQGRITRAEIAKLIESLLVTIPLFVERPEKNKQLAVSEGRLDGKNRHLQLSLAGWYENSITLSATIF